MVTPSGKILTWAPDPTRSSPVQRQAIHVSKTESRVEDSRPALNLSELHVAVEDAMNGSSVDPKFVRAFQRIAKAGKTLSDLPVLSKIVEPPPLLARDEAGGIWRLRFAAFDAGSSWYSGAKRYRAIPRSMEAGLRPGIRAYEKAFANQLSDESGQLIAEELSVAKRFLEAYRQDCEGIAVRLERDGNAADKHAAGRPVNHNRAKAPAKVCQEIRTSLEVALHDEVKGCGIANAPRTSLSLLQWFWPAEFPLTNDAADLKNMKERIRRSR